MLRLGQDVRYTFRQLAASPAFTIVCILTIALGVGANTAIFSIMNTILLRSLPVPNPQQLVYFHLKNQPLSMYQSGYDDTSLSLPVFEAMRTRHDVFTDVIAFAPLAFGKVAVRFGAEPEQAYGEMVSGNFFSGLGVQPMVGRGFTAQDETVHAPLVVLSHEWWNRRFASAPDILGQTLFIKGVPFTIVGVAPRDFRDADPGPAIADFWIPLQSRPELNPWGMPPGDGTTLYGSPNWLCLLLVGRLRPGISPQQAAAQLTPVFQRALTNASPLGPEEPRPQLVFSDVRGIGNLREEYQHPLQFLMSMVVLVLLIASANIALLLIARNANRQREFALRRALGASARVLFFQLLLESSILVAAGSALGWLFATSATQALTAWSGLDIVAAPDQRVLLFTLGISVTVALVFGLAPMRATAGVPLTLALKSAAATSHTDRNRLRGRKLVVALQISLCVVLLFAANLLYRTLRNIESRDLGMRTAGLLVFGISPQNIHTDTDAIRFHTNLLDAMRRLPGVESATVMQVRIGSGGSNNDGVLVDGRNPLPNKPFAPMRTNLVGSAFLHTLGIPLYLGRDIESSDTEASPKVAVINQTFADRYLPGVNPIGHQVSYFNRGSSYTIVGVAQNSRYTKVSETDRPIVYFPFTQVPGISDMQYELRTSGDPQRLALEATKLVHKIDPNLPLERPTTQQAQFAQTISQERLLANLSVFFGGLAAFLVAIGLYGTISYSISRRTMEIGVRMALGAQRKEVLGMVLRESTLLAVVGLAVGLPLAIAVARTMRSMLYGLTPSDPVALVLVLAGIAMITLGASLLPACRAASLDPMRALRME